MNKEAKIVAKSQYYSFSISVVLTFIFSTTDIPFQYYCVFAPPHTFYKTSYFAHENKLICSAI